MTTPLTSGGGVVAATDFTSSAAITLLAIAVCNSICKALIHHAKKMYAMSS